MEHLDKIHKIKQLVEKNSISSFDGWFEGLEDRKKEEVLLHDKLRDMNFRKNASQEEVKKYFSNSKMLDGYDQDDQSLFTDNQIWFDNDYLLKNSISGLSDNYFNKLISECSKGSIVLDMASGFGRDSITAAKSNANFVVGVDLSPKSVEEANRLAEENNLDNVIFAVADCENLYFEDNTFDLVICARMLHHIDFEPVMKEVQRVLKEGGKAICIEALGINPILNLYRRYTPAQRTHWEAANILTFKQIRIARKYFSVQNINYWHILSPLAKFSYRLLPLLNFLDRFFLTKIPIFNRLSWIFTFELKKGPEI